MANSFADIDNEYHYKVSWSPFIFVKTYFLCNQSFKYLQYNLFEKNHFKKYEFCSNPRGFSKIKCAFGKAWIVI